MSYFVLLQLKPRLSPCTARQSIHLALIRPNETNICTNLADAWVSCCVTDRADDDEKDETTPWAEQQSWEEHQIAKAISKASKAGRPAPPQYEMVFEEQIQFVMDDVLAGAPDPALPTCFPYSALLSGPSYPALHPWSCPALRPCAPISPLRPF